VDVPLGLVVAAWAALLCGVFTKTPLIINEEVGLVYGAITAAALVGPAIWALFGGAVALVVLVVYRRPHEPHCDWE
jgi:hypothetical protein